MTGRAGERTRRLGLRFTFRSDAEARDLRAHAAERARSIETAAGIALVAVGLVCTALRFAPLHQGIGTEWIENRTFQTPPFANVVVEISPASGQAG